MRILSSAALAAFALAPLAACQSADVDAALIRIDRISRGVDVALALAEATLQAKPALLAKIRGAAATARVLLASARAALVAGDRARADDLAREADAKIREAVEGVPGAPEAVQAATAPGPLEQ